MVDDLLDLQMLCEQLKEAVAFIAGAVRKYFLTGKSLYYFVRIQTEVERIIHVVNFLHRQIPQFNKINIV